MQCQRQQKLVSSEPGTFELCDNDDDDNDKDADDDNKSADCQGVIFFWPT